MIYTNSMSKIFTISAKPVSINKMRRGRTFLTKEYKDFKDDAIIELQSQKPKINRSKSLTMRLTFFCRELYRGDIDNSVKSVLDSCKEAGIFEDDRYITVLILKKEKADRDYVEIEIIN